MLYYAVRYVQRKIVSAFGGEQHYWRSCYTRDMGGIMWSNEKGGLHHATANQKDLWDGDLVIIYCEDNANMEEFYWRRRNDKERKFQLSDGRLSFALYGDS